MLMLSCLTVQPSCQSASKQSSMPNLISPARLGAWTETLPQARIAHMPASF